MPMTPEERKQRLGFGGLTKIARRTRRTLGHVSQVNKNPQSRPDERVMRAITREIMKNHPDIEPADVWSAAS